MTDAWSKAEKGLAEPLLTEEKTEEVPRLSDIRGMLRDVQILARKLRLSKRKNGPALVAEDVEEAQDLVYTIEVALRSGANITRAENREFRAAMATIENVARARDDEAVVSVVEDNRTQSPQEDRQRPQQQQQVVGNMEMERLERSETDVALEEETETEIVNLNERVFTVNQIYRDIASLVSDQQEDVDTIESQISTALSRTNKAQHQLIRANAKKTKKMKCCFYFAVTLAIFSVILVLAIIGFGKVAGATVI